MFIVLLRFSKNKDQVGAFLEGHKVWIQRGFDDGVFLLAGTLKPMVGGGLLAHNITAEALQARVNEDPFVAEDVVTAEIIEMSPSRADNRLDFLVD
ncbi:YciI family protein [Parasedimentitalea maritima]|uniref:YCII-related domain-containing protein n=1 Tax=Parasedimentitalea maritima TaxID=2578117 RepID=A0A6A4RFH3_9RHOB|nr:hypothetical protein [Zongyanglinia marina]KAE9627661.1 hypothetical protein GP644_18965 [Zongyanglinia marina]